jgi:hypothetical protein
MNYQDALRIHLLCSEYLAAIEQQNVPAMERLWNLAEQIPGLEEAIHELHLGLLEEHDEQIRDELKQVVNQTIPSAKVIDSPGQQVTAAQVMNELQTSTFLQEPTLKELITKLQTSTMPLPDELGFSRISQWGREHFGKGSQRFWQAFQQAALKIKLRQDSATIYSLAARKAPPSQG